MESLFSSCVQTWCRTELAPSRRHTFGLAAGSSVGRRGYTGSWPPWMELQAPGPGPYETTARKWETGNFGFTHVADSELESKRKLVMPLRTLVNTVDFRTTTMLSLLGSGFLYPVLTGNLSTEWDLDNLYSETNGEFFAQQGQAVSFAPGRASHLALVQLFLEVFHGVSSHHVRYQVIGGSDKHNSFISHPKVIISCSVWDRGT